MANVTYLLGAGASCHCLPTYKNFGSRFSFFKDILQIQVAPDNRGLLSKIISACQKIASEFSFHNTPDTIAKKYFHLKDDGQKLLEELKTIMILFFIYEQCVNEGFINSELFLKNEKKIQIDKRYDSFIASILKPIYSEVKINSNFNIITWNYDVQFERCFQNYCRKDFETAQLDSQSIPSLKTIEEKFRFNPNEFSIIHLNGIAYSQKQTRPISPYGSSYPSRDFLVNQLVEHYKALETHQSVFDSKTLLSFAWERDDSFPGSKEILSKIEDAALKVSSKTEILIIIGYSFPIFNREVDLKIFKQMKNLKKIYIQSPQAEDISQMIVEIFNPINRRVNSKIVQIINTLDYFHIPFEWNKEIQDPFKIVVA